MRWGTRLLIYVHPVDKWKLKGLTYWEWQFILTIQLTGPQSSPWREELHINAIYISGNFLQSFLNELVKLSRHPDWFLPPFHLPGCLPLKLGMEL